jgi:N-acylneuraminate cytidylyltransferase/CMP-N,N'-diacetyllegionaminic acid synthase
VNRSSRDTAGRTLAIIPARGGSKGVPRKNLRELAGKPLLVHTIEQAQATSQIDEVIVSTDDPEIASVARAAGAEVIQRPPALARDDAPTLPVLVHVLEQLDRQHVPNRVVTLQPTSPLRRSEQLSAAIELLTEAFDSVIGVCVAEHSPYKMFSVRGGQLSPLIAGSRPGTPRQQLPCAYRENGAVYVSWRDVLIDQNSIWGERARPYLMDAESSVDIDSLLDFTIAEALLKTRSAHAVTI